MALKVFNGGRALADASMFEDAGMELVQQPVGAQTSKRGPVVDPEALYWALTTGEIAAAALDVPEREPISPEDPLPRLDDLIITPHIAAGSPVTAIEGGKRQAENVVMVPTGKAPHGIANPEFIKTIAVMRATNPGRWDGIPDFSTALML